MTPVRVGWLVAILSGCVTAPQVRDPLPIETLEVDFPSRESGSLAFSVRLPADVPPHAAVRVSWELFVEGVRFAAGVDVAEPAAGVVVLKSPLRAKHVVWREGDVLLDVGLRGEVDVGRPGAPLVFKLRREVPVHGRPVLNIPLD